MDSFDIQPSVLTLFNEPQCRTKLLIEGIPPAYSQEEFKELLGSENDAISNWLDEDKVNYFCYRQGRVYKDVYGHLIGAEQTQFSNCHIGFKDPKDCQRFFRIYNGRALKDSYGIRGKLDIGFSILQEIPEPSSFLPPESGSFRSSSLFKEFVAAFPEFAESNITTSSSVDFEESFDAQKVPVAAVPSDLAVNLKDKIEISPPDFPKLSYASLLKKPETLASDTIMTPLTSYIAKMKLNLELESAKDRKIRERRERRERKRQEKKSERQLRQKEKRRNKKENSNPKTVQERTEKTSVTQNNSGKPKPELKFKKQSVVEKPSVNEFKNPPKILARVPETPEAVVKRFATKPKEDQSLNTSELNVPPAAPLEAQTSKKKVFSTKSADAKPITPAHRVKSGTIKELLNDNDEKPDDATNNERPKPRPKEKVKTEARAAFSKPPSSPTPLPTNMSSSAIKNDETPTKKVFVSAAARAKLEAQRSLNDQ